MYIAFIGKHLMHTESNQSEVWLFWGICSVSRIAAYKLDVASSPTFLAINSKPPGHGPLVASYNIVLRDRSVICGLARVLPMRLLSRLGVSLAYVGLNT